jgi:peptide/nickel transport system permease protein
LGLSPRTAKFIAKRLALGLLTLFLVSVVVFLATQALPSNAAQAILGKTATPQALAALSAKLHLNESVVSQYLHWLSGLFHGNLGTSAATQQSVVHLLSGRLANSAFLVVVSGVIAIPLSLGLGVLMAMRRDKTVDHGLSTATLLVASLPEFVIAIALVLLFATSVFHVFPAVSLLPPGAHAWNKPNIVVLPAATLILAVTPYISRIMRGSMVEVLESDYVTMARLKGLSERTVIWRHAVPNAVVPAIQVSALQLAWMAGGVIVVEFVFDYPGTGTALINAVTERDVPVVQAIALIIAAVYVVVNLAADLATIMLTPRLRTAGR